jgi:hypothetical protein
MEFHVTAVCTLAYVTAKFAGFAVQDRAGGFLLDVRLEMSGRTVIRVGKSPYLLDFGITHGIPPSGQTD